MEIIKAKKDNSIELANLAGMAFPGYPFEYVFSKTGVEEAINNGEQRYTLQDDTGQIIGSAVLGLDDTPMAEVKRVMVHPDYRSNGVASKLTQHLCRIANENNKLPYAEVRADQIGMQKAALSAGMTAISVEPGKHVVYTHDQLGPAREGMTFMTTGKVSLDDLKKSLRNVPKTIRQRLAVNMDSSLVTTPKDNHLVQTELVSPSDSKRLVLNKLLDINAGGPNLKIVGDDIAIWQENGLKVAFILPDRSAFVSIADINKINHSLIENSGIQIATIYVNMTDYLSTSRLGHLKYEPTSVRLWNSTGHNSEWQIGWQARYNNFGNCLHTINLDPTIKEQITKTIDVVNNN